jgi:hypothetical protein
LRVKEGFDTVIGYGMRHVIDAERGVAIGWAWRIH